MKAIIGDFQYSWSKRLYGRIILYALSAVLCLILACLGVYLIIQLIARYMDLIMITVAVILEIHFYFQERREKRLSERAIFIVISEELLLYIVSRL